MQYCEFLSFVRIAITSVKIHKGLLRVSCPKHHNNVCLDYDMLPAYQQQA